MHAYDSRQHPYVLHATLLLILLNFIVFLAEPAQLKTFVGLGPNDTVNEDTQAFYIKYAFAPQELHADLNGSPVQDPNGTDLGFAHVLETMVTAMFVHASWLHILGNMLVLIFVGPRIEGRVGSLLFLALYFASGLFGWYATYVTSPTSGFNVGASGAVAGVMGAAIITDPMAWVWIVPARIPLPLWISGLWFFGTEFWAALKAAPQDTVAHWAHVGGIFVGFAAGAGIRLYQPAAVPIPAAKPALVPSSVPHAAAHATVVPSTPRPAPVALPAQVASAAAETTHVPPIATAPAASASVKLTGLAGIKAQGSPASLHPPIAPRTAHEARVNLLAAKRIASHIKTAQWIILAISVSVLFSVRSTEGIGNAIGAGILTYAFLAAMWTALEHLAAHVHVKAHAGAQAPPQHPAST